MTESPDRERLTCRTTDELETALEGDPALIKSISCNRIVEAELLARVSEFVNLESCHFSLCDANAFAERLGELKHLSRLDLQASRLTSFPTSLAGATKLKYLSLGNNAIKSIPDEVGQLKGVIEFSMMQNRIHEVSDLLFELPLVKLNLGHNRLQSLSKSIANLTKLEMLTLLANRLTELPPEIGQLKKLESLSLNYNALTTLPVEIIELQSLEYLGIESNPFTSFPAGFKGFANSIESLAVEGKQRALFMDWTYKPSDKPVQIELADLNLCLDSESPDFAEIESKLDDAGVSELKTQVRNSINIASTVSDDYSELGCSRLGGFPDLEDESKLPRTEDGIWIFLFQLNLADVAELNGFLPKSGLLSFFVKSLEDLECRVIFFADDTSQLKTIRFEPTELTDDQDDYTETPHRIEFAASTSIPYLIVDDHTKFEAVHDVVNTTKNHFLNGHSYTQHDSHETQAASQLGGTPEEWTSLLCLGYDRKVGFCFWDAGTIAFCIHQEDLRRHDFSRVHVSLESS